MWESVCLNVYLTTGCLRGKLPNVRFFLDFLYYGCQYQPSLPLFNTRLAIITFKSVRINCDYCIFKKNMICACLKLIFYSLMHSTAQPLRTGTIYKYTLQLPILRWIQGKPHVIFTGEQLKNTPSVLLFILYCKLPNCVHCNVLLKGRVHH